MAAGLQTKLKTLEDQVHEIQDRLKEKDFMADLFQHSALDSNNTSTIDNT